MNLFSLGDHRLSSGAKTDVKIECDSLTDEDWEALAALAVKRLPKFCFTFGVPKGGYKLANALSKYTTDDLSLPILVVEDVLTTGASIEKSRKNLPTSAHEVIGVVAFARGPCPAWVTPLFVLTPEIADKGV